MDTLSLLPLLVGLVLVFTTGTALVLNHLTMNGREQRVGNALNFLGGVITGLGILAVGIGTPFVDTAGFYVVGGMAAVAGLVIKNLPPKPEPRTNLSQ